MHGRHNRTDLNSGHKYPDLPGILNYRESGDSNHIEVQIAVENPSLDTLNP